ncbi:hypothetical protein EDD11_008836 [Mortierella claussenii]|nr:hypothetical protein EDD11_008836 [Mortierella claussenii]
MTGGAFLHDIEDKDPNRKILLLVDNHGSHTVAMRSSQGFPNIRVEALPKNSTSVTQPLDAGIIAVFKRRYRHHVASRAYENSLRADIKAAEKAVQVELDGNEEAGWVKDGRSTKYVQDI